MTIITQDDVTTIAGVDDNTSWTFFTQEIRESADGTGVVTTKKERKFPVAGVLTVQLDPGPAAVIAPNGKTYPFTVPVTDSPLWPLIQAAVTIPPSTTHQQLLDAVAAWLASHTNVWASIPDKPAPLAAGANVANGYAGLDGTGKLGTAQLPISAMEYKGNWNVSTNSPTLADGTGSAGDVYKVSVAGSRNLGSGSITFDVGDYAIYNGTTWEKSDSTDAIASVAGLTGVISSAGLKTALGETAVGDAVFTAADQATARTAIDAAVAPRDAVSFPWPQGLVAFWDFQRDTAGGATVTSLVGSQVSTLTALASKTVVKDGADPGPFGPSLVLDGATAFVKAGGLGALDPSTIGDEVTVVTWVKDTANNHDDGSNGLAFRAGSHNDGSTASRQYGSYFDANSPTGSKGKYTPHISSQDGPASGYVFSADNAATARKINTGTGQGQWHMESFTFNGAELVAYIDGLSDLNLNCPEVPQSGQTAPDRNVNRNPYPLRRGLNRSATTKRFSIGGSSHWNGSTDSGFAFTTGKLGGVAVFNRALSAAEMMQIRLATLLSGEAITTHGFEVTSTGPHYLNEIGWAAGGGATNNHVGNLNSNGPEFAITRPVSGTKAYLTKTSTTIGAAWGLVGGLNSSQLARLRFKMLSALTTSAPVRPLVKVGSQWWASNTTFATAATHAADTDWSGAESKTLAIDWNIGNWKAVTISDTGSTATWQNLAKNPALTSNATNWFKSSAVTQATAARVSDGAGGFVYRFTWTGTDSGTFALGGLAFPSIGAVTAGSVYAASMQVSPSKVQKMQLVLQWLDVSNAVISTTLGGIVTVGANTPTTLTVAGTAPALATQLTVYAQSAASVWDSGTTLDLTKLLTVAGPLLPAYFDGTSTLAVWDGTAGGSTSTITGVVAGVLSLSGSTNAAYVDNALITAVGFLSSGGDGSAVRVTDLELLPS